MKTLQTTPRTRARGLTLTEAALERIDQALRKRWEETLSEFTDGKLRKLTIVEKGVLLGLSPKTVKHLYARNPIDEVTLRTTFEKLNIAPPFSKDRHCAAADTPRAPSPCIGRDSDISQIMALLETHSLVTLTGAGGIGKTRLALRIAEELKSRYPAGVWFVDLSSLDDPDLMPKRIASVLGIRAENDRPVLQAIKDFLRDKPLLLILDNCEHLLEACAVMANAILADSFLLRIVATSRERLNIRFERPCYVPSLVVPDADYFSAPHQDVVERLGRFSSVALFAERARSIRPDFEITDKNARMIASICCRLDGIPLAIELAAGLVGAMSIDDLGNALTHSFDILIDTMAAIPRHRTLGATIEWSYRLLPEEEKTLLRRLSVFADGCSLEAVKTVCGFEPLFERDILNLLSALIDKSLVRYIERDGISRYVMPETVRQYAMPLLTREIEANSLVRSLHRAHCLALAEIANPKLVGKDQGEWTKRLEREHDNFRAALASSLADGKPTDGMALCDALCDFWHLAGHVSEGRSWCEKMLDAFSGETHDPQYTKVLSAAGQLAQVHGDLDVAARRARHATLYSGSGG